MPPIHPLLTKRSVGTLLGIVSTLLGLVVANMSTSSNVKTTVAVLAESVGKQRIEIESLSHSDSAIQADLAYLKKRAMADSIRTAIEEEFENRYRIKTAKKTQNKEITYAQN